jgi:hypothetical protein
MVISLKIVQRSDKKNSHVNTIPPPQGWGRRCKYCSRGIYGSYGRHACINLREGSFEWKLKVVVHFLRVKKEQRATSPSHPPHLWVYWMDKPIQ